MKLVSWNVNGLRACLGKGFLDFCAVADADIICLQETKMRPEQAEFDLPGYHRYWNSADKAGYSGTAVFTRRQPLSVTYDFGIDEHRDYLLDLDAKKPVVYCGDLNVAHQEIDIKNPGPNRRNPGFTDEEREKMTKLLSSGFVDTFRYLYPDKTGAYSWWSYRFNARKNNAGWRIDYFIVSERLKDKIRNADIWSEVLGSDHCPVVLDLDV